MTLNDRCMISRNRADALSFASATYNFRFRHTHTHPSQGRNHWGEGRGVRTPSPPKKKWKDHPNFFDEECDYRDYHP